MFIAIFLAQLMMHNLPGAHGIVYPSNNYSMLSSFFFSWCPPPFPNELGESLSCQQIVYVYNLLLANKTQKKLRASLKSVFALKNNAKRSKFPFPAFGYGFISCCGHFDSMKKGCPLNYKWLDKKVEMK